MHKIIPTHSKAVELLANEVQAGICWICDVSSLPLDFPHRPPDSKVTHYTVAVSGDPSAGVDYMVVCPYRVDTSLQSDGAKLLVYDIDPAIIVLDSESKPISSSGLALYHQNFSGRTSHIPNIISFSGYEQSVAHLRSQVVTGKVRIDKAPPETLSALHHAARVIKRRFS